MMLKNKLQGRYTREDIERFVGYISLLHGRKDIHWDTLFECKAVVVTRFYSKVTLELDDDDDLQDLEWRLCERSSIHKVEPETEALDIMITKGELK